MIIVGVVIWVIVVLVTLNWISHNPEKAQKWFLVIAFVYALITLAICAQAGYATIARGPLWSRILESIVMWGIILPSWILPEFPGWLSILPVALGWISTFIAIQRHVRDVGRENHIFQGAFGVLFSVLLLIVTPIGLSFGILILRNPEYNMFKISQLFINILMVVGWVIGLITVIVRHYQR